MNTLEKVTNKIGVDVSKKSIILIIADYLRRS